MERWVMGDGVLVAAGGVGVERRVGKRRVSLKRRGDQDSNARACSVGIWIKTQHPKSICKKPCLSIWGKYYAITAKQQEMPSRD